MAALVPGQIYWAVPDTTVGREQAGRRPVVVVSGSEYNATVDTLAWVVPVTTVPRGWRNHVELHGKTGLPERSFAMTEQLRTVSRARLAGLLGAIDDPTLKDIRMWLHDFLRD
ncbi:MAG TPA: type II toxin-antitoxin system PemK/MazF family toxin [Arachnia sp.]|nr:type II toxin-antitoxin system PemK/MazF family toxin [Arachnia sp.]